MQAGVMCNKVLINFYCLHYENQLCNEVKFI